MKFYRIAKVETEKFPNLKLTFDDGFEGQRDVSANLPSPEGAETSEDAQWFSRAEIIDNGRALGWNAGANRFEICADALPYALEEARAKRFQGRFHAAE